MPFPVSPPEKKTITVPYAENHLPGPIRLPPEDVNPLDPIERRLNLKSKPVHQTGATPGDKCGP